MGKMKKSKGVNKVSKKDSKKQKSERNCPEENDNSISCSKEKKATKPKMSSSTVEKAIATTDTVKAAPTKDDSSSLDGEDAMSDDGEEALSDDPSLSDEVEGAPSSSGVKSESDEEEDDAVTSDTWAAFGARHCLDARITKALSNMLGASSGPTLVQNKALPL